MKRRFVSMLLAVLLVVSILPVAAFAANPATITSVTGTYAEEKLTSITIKFTWGMGYGTVTDAKAVLQTALLSGQKVGDDPNAFGDFSNFGAIAGKSEAESRVDYGFIQSALVNGHGIVDYVYDSNDVTLSIPTGLAQGTYYVYLWVTYNSLFYPDCLLCVINVDAEGNATYTPAITGALRNAFSTDVQEYQEIRAEGASGEAEHTHVWQAETSGLGTKEAKTTIHCTADGCDLEGQYMDVVLTASDVTLPGNVFTAEYNVSYMSAGRAAFPLTVSQVPGFKYSPDGTNYTAIDMNTFEGKQGYYQASILVMDDNDPVENLYVQYTVSDPVVTAATGDERPVELMLAGMVTFAALAALAFVLDSKRRAGF